MSIKKEKVFVIGHKNPDTDSICSAICYAHLKGKLNENVEYIAVRAGHLNEESQYVMERFGVQPPVYIKDVRTQVRDIEIRETEGVDQGISLKTAWTLMRDKNVVTLPITEGNKLAGLITIGDIATSYMDVYDSRILATAKTRYKNILETLDGHLVTGDENAVFDKGKVLIAAANPDLMENYIEEHDLVILGNRYESQLCAIEMNADCIIVCEGAPVSMTIRKLAEEKGCTVIGTPHDTYTVARLINQSMPIAHFMRRDSLVTFRLDEFTETIKEVMAKKRHRDFPILDKYGNYVGMISRRNLLNMSPKKLILVDHNEKNQAVNGIENAEILEIIDHHRLGSLETIAPVFFRNQPLGCTATIIYQMYRENGVEITKTIASLLCAAIISDTLMYRSPTCTDYDRRTAEELASIAGIKVEEFAREMFKAGSNLKDKEPEEIFYQDYKTFSSNDISFGVGQINAMTEEELADIKRKLRPCLKETAKATKVNMVFFMLTNIISESTELLYVGENAEELIQNAFGVQADEDSFRLEGVISRKKQLIPALMASMQQ
ncbi:MAG: putative manganese-dependent inorganic diphosphatase [Lachnospiraceae bacterium]|nr:putative manganese-dependent inorganic diphosphatase [Lachnospiraceae bacterium]MCM1238016.1 putative manganese-dependent inorganic diphosphatase [Lachnospiraceae bacterium]MCM1302527.1 putative manganese-dependent inorganic diphosphatase [Butyrivibrio sp.]MCM1342345.1 putative manganese-dependent inorganic diphosphatase [Muribaculaceae bacterium]MCM1410888.1 putative manganese-dependent inorganic diphosphatase [Lachnospiraceae bacterium]